MRVALYARATPTAPGREAVDQTLAELKAYAAQRGWEIGLEMANPDPSLQKHRKALKSLLQLVPPLEIKAIVIRNVSHLTHSLRHLTGLGQRLADLKVALISLEDDLDTTDLTEAIRWLEWLATTHRLHRQLRDQAFHLLRQRHASRSHPAAAINTRELLSWWEGRGGRKPRTVRQIAQKLGLSETTIRKRLQALRAAGQVNDEARAQALARRPRRGGRPGKPIDDEALRAEWTARRSLPAMAANLRVSRSRVRARLRELGLLKAEPTRRPEAPGRTSDVE
jgi:DNA invertase Pin-like site-specific DNA recombinase